jgi:hypothetical protein
VLAALGLVDDFPSRLLAPPCEHATADLERRE